MKHAFQPLSGEDPDDIEIVYDEEIHHIMEADKRKRKLQILSLIFGVFLIICVLLSVTTVTLLSIFLTRYTVPDPPNYFHQEDVRDSVEFQIALRPHEKYTERDEMFDLWISAINAYSNLTITREEASTEIYTQFHYSTGGSNHCKTPSDFKVRVRHLFYAQTTVLDIKGGENIVPKDKSCNQAYWPAEEYYDSSSQKCEEDMHPCFSKFTRGTAVTFQEPHKQFDTCKDLINVFPDAFYNTKDVHNSIGKEGVGNWYKLQWKGTLGEYTHYEMQFTLEYAYSTTEVILGHIPMVEGEWSLRFWTDAGNPWEMDVVEELERLFYLLVLEFDTPDYAEHYDCANDFLDGGTENGIDITQHEDDIY